jgi:hypothetical protein
MSRRGYFLMMRYGITQEQFDKRLEEQGGGCAFCGAPDQPDSRGRTTLYVDHDHTTDEWRQILCPRCNSLLGHVEKSPELIEKIMAYVRDRKRS